MCEKGPVHGSACKISAIRGERVPELGLGRVITRRRGCRRTATGGMYCKVTVSSMFSDFGLGGKRASSSGRPDRLSSAAEVAAEPYQAAIAAISGLMPTMFMTRVKL